MTPAWAIRAVFCFAICLAGAGATAAAELPLCDRIDRLIERDTLAPRMSPADDAEFLRRVWLDLAGVIPAEDEARRFFADRSPDKRAAMVNRLVSSPALSRQLVAVCDQWLMERRTLRTGSADQWQAYLLDSMLAGKPLDQLAREVLTADGSEPQIAAATAFFLEREAEPNAVARDIGRLLLGMDLECAQCHDHPTIDDYYQLDYHGLLAFVARTSRFGNRKGPAFLAEKADGEAGFKSVFTGYEVERLAPRLPKQPPVTEPPIESTKQYLVKPAKGVRGIPRYSRRAVLSRELTASPQFARNVANRLWAYMFGRGLVHPLDMHHADNPPAHPELLDLLARELMQARFDPRPLLGQMARTRAYARACEAPSPRQLAASDPAQRTERLERERAACAARAAAAVASFAKAHESASAALARSARAKPPAGSAAEHDAGEYELHQSMVDAKIALAEVNTRLIEARLVADYRRAAKGEPAKAARAWKELVDHWSARSLVPAIKPLEAEPLAMSILQATGLLTIRRATAEKVVAKANDGKSKQPVADAATSTRQRLIEKRLAAEVGPEVRALGRLFGGRLGDDFQATVNQALFFANGPNVNQTLTPKPGSLVARLAAMSDPGGIADALYLNVLTRFPSRPEKKAVSEFLAGCKDERSLAVEEMIWGLLASTEFRFNH